MSGRIRAAWATLRSAPWRRAPLLLLRRPGVLATVAGACMVTAASVAAVPLFLSSAGTESVTLQAAERCPRDTGAVLTSLASAEEVRAPGADPFLPLAARLGPSNRWARLEQVSLTSADGTEQAPVSVVTRDGALEHVEVLDGTPGPGVWITDRAAEVSGLAVGDVATVGAARVPVVGVYRDLSGTAVDDFWCSNAEQVLLEARGFDLVRPPPMLLADADTFATIMHSTGATEAEAAWEAPLRGRLTVADAEELVASLACGATDAEVLEWCVAGQPLVPRRTGGFRRDPVPAVDNADFVERYFHSHLPFVIERSRAIQTSVGGGIWPLAAFATLAGGGLVAAAASLWFDRRRRDVTLLTVRGVSPAGLGIKAALELSLPMLLGVAAGVGLAYGMVVAFGPSPDIESVAIQRAALGGVLALVGAAATVGLVVTRRVQAHGARHARRVSLGVIPWELLLAWASVVSYRRLGDWGIPVGRGADVSRVDLWGLLFPVLFLLTAIAVVSRLLVLALRPIQALSRSWPTALYLAVRRVGRYRVAVVGLVAAGSVAAGVLAYAATMNRSLDATLQAKARTFVGSDMAVKIPRSDSMPPALAERATELHVYADAWIERDERDGATVVSIDPATFERAAFWDPSFSDSSLDAILAELAAPAAEGRVQAVVVGAEIDRTAVVGIVDAGTERLTIEPIRGVSAFPGMKRGKATIYIAASRLEELDLTGGRKEIWIRGDRADALAELAAADTAFTEDRLLDEVAGRTSFVTVSWTFGFMRSLGISAGLLVIGGIATYLDARRRGRLLAYAFMRRMGLSARRHRRALAVELAASVLVGCLLGLALAFLAAALAHQRIDPVPGFPPDPLLRPAVALAAGLAAGAVVVTAIATVLGQRRVDRDDPVEVLRAGA